MQSLTIKIFVDKIYELLFVWTNWKILEQKGWFIIINFNHIFTFIKLGRYTYSRMIHYKHKRCWLRYAMLHKAKSKTLAF